jgi:hypothetical protein
MAQALGIDTVVLVDGGTDSLMCGDEAGLGTPQEDMASLVAAQSVSVARKFLVCLGFGIDAYHGVCHAHFLENAAALIREGGYLGNWSLLREMEEFVLYDEAFQFARARTSQEASIVNSSIIGAVNGHFGDHHASRRTEGSKLFINPFMGIYWAFQLDCVARRNLYLDHIKQTDDYGELSLAIEAFRSTVAKTRPWKDIPG